MAGLKFGVLSNNCVWCYINLAKFKVLLYNLKCDLRDWWDFNLESSEKMPYQQILILCQNYLLMPALYYIIIIFWLVIMVIGTDYITQPYRQQEAICDATEAIYELFLARDFPEQFINYNSFSILYQSVIH